MVRTPQQAIDDEILDQDTVMAAAQEQMFGTEDAGFCTECGHQQDGCEPDACNYECEACGKPAVFGASEIVLQITA